MGPSWFEAHSGSSGTLLHISKLFLNFSTGFPKGMMWYLEMHAHYPQGHRPLWGTGHSRVHDVFHSPPGLGPADRPLWDICGMHGGNKAWVDGAGVEKKQMTHFHLGWFTKKKGSSKSPEYSVQPHVKKDYGTWGGFTQNNYCGIGAVGEPTLLFWPMFWLSLCYSKHTFQPAPTIWRGIQ